MAGVAVAAVAPARGPAAPGGRPVPVAAAGPAHRFEPAAIASGPRMSRKRWLTIGASGAAVVLAVAAFVVLRPEPPSPAGAVREYFDHLGSGDTAAALSLVDTDGELSPDAAPLLVPAALASAANRPTDVTVTSARAYAGDDRYTVVTARYKIGEQPIEQEFAVVATGDDETPYRLEQPFLYLTVELPGGLDVAVNGVAVDAAAVTGGTPAFPGAYQGTTSGNALFAGATQAATYDAGSQGTTARIDLAQLEIAPGAPGAVQKATEEYLDANCVTGPGSSYATPCPLDAPSVSWSQTTTWAITAYPQVQLSPADPGRTQVRFATGTSGSAGYTITYTDFGGVTKTQTGTVPIDVSGSAGIGNDGAIEIALGY